jgi:hypothetical protein
MFTYRGVHQLTHWPHRYARTAYLWKWRTLKHITCWLTIKLCRPRLSYAPTSGRSDNCVVGVIRPECAYSTSPRVAPLRLRNAVVHCDPQELNTYRRVLNAHWFIMQSQKPEFQIFEVILAIAFLGLLDGGFSGMSIIRLASVVSVAVFVQPITPR